jgi:Neprosin
MARVSTRRSADRGTLKYDTIVPGGRDTAIKGTSRRRYDNTCSRTGISAAANRVKGVPQPKSNDLAAPPSIENEGGYFHAIGFQNDLPAGTSGMEASQTQQDPEVDPSDPQARSLSQMWLLDWHAGPSEENQGLSDVEFEWDVDPPLFGSGGAHLFIYRFDGGGGTCYNAGSYYRCPTATNCPNTGPGSPGYPATNGYVQVSTTESPGELLTPNVYDEYIAEDYEGNWWILHGSTWLGYYAGCAWANPIKGLWELQAGGEVYSSYSETPDTQMGNGQPGDTPNSAQWTSMWTTGKICRS